MGALLFPLSGAFFLIHLVVTVMVIAALVDAALHREGAYLAAGKQTKIFWIIVLVIGLLVTIVGLIAAIVYFVDVRPALKLTGGGRGGGGNRPSSSDGPYGPYRG